MWASGIGANIARCLSDSQQKDIEAVDQFSADMSGLRPGQSSCHLILQSPGLFASKICRPVL